MHKFYSLYHYTAKNINYKNNGRSSETLQNMVRSEVNT